ncbi:hypothetical protein CI102_13161 [Trichoderma harzianum]|nr:hypothetical protein CI102_13161 [Trichoderma harzianum]
MLAELQTKRTRQRRTKQSCNKGREPAKAPQIALCPPNANLAPTYFAFCWCCCCGFQHSLRCGYSALFSSPPAVIWCCRNPGYHHLPSFDSLTSATVRVSTPASSSASFIRLISNLGAGSRCSLFAPQSHSVVLASHLLFSPLPIGRLRALGRQASPNRPNRRDISSQHRLRP